MSEPLPAEFASKLRSLLHQRLAECNKDLGLAVSELGSHIHAQRKDAIRELLSHTRSRLDRMDRIFGLFDELVDQ